MINTITFKTNFSIRILLLSLLLVESLCQSNGTGDYGTTTTTGRMSKKGHPKKFVAKKGKSKPRTTRDYIYTTGTGGWGSTWEDTTYPDTTEDPTDAEMETKIVTDVEIGNEMHTMTLKFRIRKK